MTAPVAPTMPDASLSTLHKGDGAPGRLPLPAAIATPTHRRLSMLADRAEHFSREAAQLIGASAANAEWLELVSVVQVTVGTPIDELSRGASLSVKRDLAHANLQLTRLVLLVSGYMLGRRCDVAEAPVILEELASWLYTAAGHTAS